MSTAAIPVSVKSLDHELNQQILAGDIMGAFERFYADDVVMQENSETPRVGKEANRKAELAFLDSVEQFHGARLLGGAVEGDRSFSEWEIDVTYKGAGRFVLTQAAARTWRDGKVVYERFYYSKG
jgi:ketosteroid isomerase-like protein